jgi:hypothetical protein
VIDEEIELVAVVVIAFEELHEDEEEVDEEDVVEETFLFSPLSRISLAILFSLSFSEFRP